MEDIRKKCNPMVNLSKFTPSKNILCKVVALSYNQFRSQTFFLYLYTSTLRDFDTFIDNLFFLQQQNYQNQYY